jgi:hypothetical protein
MNKFGCSGVAAGLIGGAMLLYGAVPATSATLPSPTIAGPGETTTMIEEVQRKRERKVRRGDSRRYSRSERRRDYDRHRHGPRYSYRRPGFHHNYGGYWYSSPWWIGPSIGFGITVPSVTLGYGSAHVQWCLSRYRSYDPSSDSFLGYDGYRHRCNSPYR